MKTLAPTCGLETCDRPIRSRGYCDTHYRRLHRYGDPSYTKWADVSLREASAETPWRRKATPDNSDPCLICKKPVFLNKYSAGRGKMIHRACRQAELQADPNRPTHCAYCEQPFESKQRTKSRGGWTLTCDKSCARKLGIATGNHPFKTNPRYGVMTAEEAAERASIRGEVANRKRRARLLGVPREPYTTKLIAERDGYVCGLCNGAVDMTMKWPEPWCATVDHILPLSRGGDDTLANVQLAHARCNLQKHNRV